MPERYIDKAAASNAAGEVAADQVDILAGVEMRRHGHYFGKLERQTGQRISELPANASRAAS
jgi:hypothetical protein